MFTRRPRPEINVTSLSKLIVGDSSCEWYAWFKAHHYYKNLHSDFDRVGYIIKHTALLNRAREMLESQGKVILTESQNWFEIKGKTATLKGRPDLIALGDTYVVCDAKTGRERPSDVVQVMIYMWALPYAYSKYKERSFDGLLFYPDQEQHISAALITDEFRVALLKLIERISSSVEARKVPSYSECKYCDISKEYCADRIEDEQQSSVMTDLF